jgi:hypothetical protein
MKAKIDLEERLRRSIAQRLERDLPIAPSIDAHLQQLPISSHTVAPASAPCAIPSAPVTHDTLANREPTSPEPAGVPRSVLRSKLSQLFRHSHERVPLEGDGPSGSTSTARAFAVLMWVGAVLLLASAATVMMHGDDQDDDVDESPPRRSAVPLAPTPPSPWTPPAIPRAPLPPASLLLAPLLPALPPSTAPPPSHAPPPPPPPAPPPPPPSPAPPPPPPSPSPPPPSLSAAVAVRVAEINARFHRSPAHAAWRSDGLLPDAGVLVTRHTPITHTPTLLCPQPAASP